LYLAAAILVHPQIGGHLVAVLAVVLTIGLGMYGAVAMLFGVLMLCRGSPVRWSFSMLRPPTGPERAPAGPGSPAG
jgi:hypothetical protein